MLFNMVLEKTHYIPAGRDGPAITSYRFGGIHFSYEHFKPPAFLIQFLTPLDFRKSLEILKYVSGKERLEEGNPLEVSGDLDSTYLLVPLNYHPDDIIGHLGEEPQYMRLILPDGSYIWNNRKMPEITGDRKEAVVSVRRSGRKLPEHLFDVMQKFGINAEQNVLSSVFAQFERELVPPR